MAYPQYRIYDCNLTNSVSFSTPDLDRTLSEQDLSSANLTHLATYSACISINIIPGSWRRESALFSDSVDTVTRLGVWGLSIAVVKNNSMLLAAALLTSLGIERHFLLIIGDDNVSAKNDTQLNFIWRKRLFHVYKSRISLTQS
ncbi:MAG: hypothetical protein ACTXOO_01775 [Sodalis sp. (in: enterobacteria)]